MARKAIQIQVETDSAGKVTSTHSIDGIGQGSMEIDLTVKLVNPSNIGFSGILDVESELPGSENRAKSFDLNSGKAVSLGRWRLTPEQDKLMLVGETKPKINNKIVSIELSAESID